MKIDLNNKLDNAGEINNEIDKLSSKDKFTLIFKMNNGLALENELNAITHDSYKYVSTEENDNLKFVNQNDDCVEIDVNGKIFNWPVILPAQFAQWFAEIAQMRLNKTNRMFKEIGIN